MVTFCVHSLVCVPMQGLAIVLSRLQLEPYYDHESHHSCSGESVGCGHLLEIDVTVIMVWLHGCIMARS